MFKRRTSKVRQRRQVRVLRASVMSPRIFWYDFRKALWGCVRLLVILALVGAAGWGVWRGVEVGLLENEEFKLRQIVLNENTALDEIRLLDVAGIDLEGSLFDCDADDIRKSLISLPEVAAAKVKCNYPGTLEVTVAPRTPFVWVACESQSIPPRDLARGFLVDRSGHLFRCTRGLYETARKLPVIEIRDGGASLKAGEVIDHPDFARGLRLYRTALDFSADAVEWVDTIRQHKAWGSKLVTRDEIEATFGHEHLRRQMEDFLAAVGHAREKGDRIATIQLIGKRNLPVTFHEVSPPRAIPVPEPAPETPAETDISRLLNR
ncbi:cell division protein FtsQ/DivIB [Haloferula rosea]|uniref:FtsQ-type POTRA domain-containing protein n=1 Tax=Haloferula rosea TaxID=490093 RepID=A0A934RBL8_9BACT|nr:FtsQ-type POTRA domain-containing protein [Haloferula rosea]MBK1825480.1 FtsQ-type POTRA domain-containing protein [Haloferula rosea]